MIPKEALELFEYDRWASDRVLDAAEAAGEAFLTERSQGIGSVRDTMVHVIDGALMWLQRCKGEPLPEYLYRYDRFATVGDVRAHAHQINDLWQQYLSSVGPEEMERVVDYVVSPRGAGPSASTPVRHIATQVYFHGSHHRSECCELLSRAGQRPQEVNQQTFYMTVYGQMRRPPQAS